PTVELEDLTKRYRSTVAVRSLSLRVEPGAILGLVGPNGAGKTTLLNMMAGLLEPSEGTVRLFGRTYAEAGNDIRAQTGVMRDDPGLYESLTGSEHLSFTGSAYGLDPAEVAERSREVLAFMDLEQAAGETAETYSAGMRKKLALACILVLLDEPFATLDPEAALRVEELLRRLSAGGATVVLSSHVLDRVDRLCSELAFINKGELILRGPPDELRARGAEGKEAGSLEELYMDLVAPEGERRGLSWL
ncbi:MAG: ABC transporter ATP-binding protein, partial [Acidobacteria bacterium]|nr:ABC transporter ATP-binding protein [Acidobacteriota bacterium]